MIDNEPGTIIQIVTGPDSTDAIGHVLYALDSTGQIYRRKHYDGWESILSPAEERWDDLIQRSKAAGRTT